MVDRQRVVLYGVLPACVCIGIIACYFAPVDWLSSSIAPSPNRELGVLESLQAALLQAMAVVSWRARGREPRRWPRYAWCAIALFALLVFLEETDYGMHWYRAWAGLPYDPANNTNLHNVGRRTKRIMQVVDTVLVLGFAVAPLLRRYVPERLREFVPSPYSILTLLVVLSLGPLSRGLEANGWSHSGALHKNFSEFRELPVYWLALLYLWERTPAPLPAASTPGSGAGR